MCACPFGTTAITSRSFLLHPSVASTARGSRRSTRLLITIAPSAGNGQRPIFISQPPRRLRTAGRAWESIRGMRLEGAFVAMATPFLPDGSIGRRTLQRMVEFQIERGVDGIFAASTVGEYVHLTAEERYELVGLTVEYAAGRVPVLGGAGDISPERVIRHCRELKAAGAACSVIAPPYYYGMKQEDLVAHYERVADRIEIPW